MENKKVPEAIFRAMEEAILADEDAPKYAKAVARYGPAVRALFAKLEEFREISMAKVRAEDAAWFEEVTEYFELVTVGLDQFLSQSRGQS